MQQVSYLVLCDFLPLRTTGRMIVAAAGLTSAETGTQVAGGRGSRAETCEIGPGEMRG